VNVGGKRVISETGKLFSMHYYEKIMHRIIIQITLNDILRVISMYIPRVKKEDFVKIFHRKF
jgi:hypothetical protein